MQLPLLVVVRGILSENLKDGKVTVHSAKNTNKFDSTIGRFATHADQVNLGVAAALRSNIYGGVQRATSLTTTVSGGPDADDCAYVEFKVDGSPSALSNSFIGAFQVPSSWPTFPVETLAPGDASPDFLDLFRRRCTPAGRKMSLASKVSLIHCG